MEGNNSDYCLHGYFSYANLFEGNYGDWFNADDYLGPQGPYNTWFRNLTSHDYAWIQNHHKMNLLGNEAVLVWDTIGYYCDPYITDPDSIQLLDLYGYIIVEEDTTSQTHEELPPWPRSPSYQLPDVSYYLFDRPDLLDTTYTWPPIGPRIDLNSPPTSQDIPARAAFEEYCDIHLEDCYTLHIGTGREYEPYIDTIDEALQYALVEFPGVPYWRLLVYESDTAYTMSSIILDEGSPIDSLTIRGVGGYPEVHYLARPGGVVIDADSTALQLVFENEASLRLEGLTFQHVANHTDMPRQDTHALIVAEGLHVTIDNCRFLDVRATGIVPDFPVGVVYYNSPEGVPGNIDVSHCVFADCEGPEAGAILATGASVEINSCTFHRNEAGEGGSWPSSVRVDSCVLNIQNSLFTGAGQSSEPAFLIESGSGTVSYSLFDAEDWASDNQEIQSGTDNLVLSSEEAATFVSYMDPTMEVWDFELKASSQCLEKGHPDSLDFDLTRSDIGWKPVYPVQEYTDHVFSDGLSRGWYQLSGDGTMIFDVIPAGTVVRMTDGSTLQLWYGGSPDGLVIGSPDAPRTAIVGSQDQDDPDDDDDQAAQIWIGHHAGPTNPVVMDGVLFNYAPGEHVDSLQLYFKYADLRMDTNRVRFMHYYGSELLFEKCLGTLEGFNFENQEENHLGQPRRVSILDSDLDVVDCAFGPTGDHPALKIHGPGGSGTPLVSGCYFAGNGQSIPVDLVETIVSMHGNVIDTCWTTGLIQTQTTTYMVDGAKNRFLADDRLGYELADPFIEMEAGFLDLFCGYNDFVYYNWEFPNPIIHMAPTDTIYNSDPRPWLRNFFGTDCESPILESDLNSETLMIIPNWAEVGASLTACDQPYNELCNYMATPPDELLQQGIVAEGEQRYADAHEFYRALLLLYPTALECNEATLRLKGLGIKCDYGAEHYAEIRDDLFSAADTSEAAQVEHLPVLERCSGWCVEAYHGDRELAVDTLNTMLAVTTDPIDRDTITRALLEIQTYPKQGGSSAAGPRTAQQLLEESRAVRALLDYRRGSGLRTSEIKALMLPERFEISRIYPNPFNPLTQIEFTLPRSEQVTLKVYNLLGQQVATLLNDKLDAGWHRVPFHCGALGSGVYFAVARTECEFSVRKMLLVK